MADVSNSIRLDASQAIASLDKLAFSVNTVNQRIEFLNTQARVDPFKTLGNSARVAGNRISAAEARVLSLRNELRTLGQTGSTAGQQVSKAGDDIGKSLQLASRIIATQFLVRGLSQFIQVSNQAADAAREFQLTIARTAAIAGSGPGSTIGELSASVRQLAVDLGQPLAEVASSSFQALQNDIADTVQESIEFVRVASELSIATGSELETSVNSLTSILKSYGDEAGTAAENSDILFRAVDVGRISLDELENRLGTITPQAAALGVTFTESAAAVSSLTLAGLDTAKAATQLRNIFAKLIRPTTDLQSAFERLGVTSGQELVQQYGGLQGALQALTEAFDGNETAVANAFGTIRGQLGVLNLLANEGQEFDRVLGEIKNSTGAVDDALTEVNSTSARDFERQLAKAQDTLLDIGNVLLDFRTNALSVFNTIVGSGQTAVAIVEGLGIAAGVAFARFATGLAAARASVLLTLGPLAALGGALALEFANQQNITTTLRELEQSSVEANKAITDSYEESQKQNTAAVEDNLRRQENLIGDFVKTSSSTYANLRRSFERDNERIEISFLRTTEEFRDSREKLIEGLFDFIDSIDDKILDSTGRIQDAAQDLEDIRFEGAQRGLSDVQQATNELARSQRTAAEARRQLLTAGLDEAARAAANERQRTAESQAREALRSAERLDNLQLIQRAQRNLETIVNNRLQSEIGLRNQLLSIDETEARRQVDRAEEIRRRQEAITQEIDALNRRRDEQGRPRDRSAQAEAERRQRLTTLATEFEALEREFSGLTIIDQAGLRKFQNDAAQALREGINQADVDLSQSIVKFREQLKSTEFESVVRLDALISSTSVEAFKKEIEEAITGIDVGQRFQQRQTITNELIKEQRTLRTEIQKTQLQFEQQLDEVRAVGQRAFAAPVLTRNQGVTGAIKAFLEEGFGAEDPIERVARIQTQTESLITQVANAALRLKNEGGPAIRAVGVALTDVQQQLVQSGLREESSDVFDLIQKQIDTARQAALTLQQQIDQEANLKGTEQDVQQLENELINVSGATRDVSKDFKGIKDESSGASTATQNLKNSSSALVSPITNAKNAMAALKLEAIAAGQAIASALQAGGGAQTVFFGGSIKRNFGGDLTRGQDQRLVAAAPGEFFVNQRSSDRFFSQLQAINAGQNPVYREQGGPVTNIGDINVNVDASNARSVDGREIARTLNRELRRNSSSLRRG